MIELLKTRFESNRIHRGELSWAVVLARLEAHPEALDALRWMEESGGEPDVIGTDGERILFADCAKESPAGRRSLCYDETARKARKKAPPKGSAEEQAARHGISLMTEQQYRFLQTLGEFDLKTSSWIATFLRMKQSAAIWSVCGTCSALRFWMRLRRSPGPCRPGGKAITSSTLPP